MQTKQLGRAALEHALAELLPRQVKSHIAYELPDDFRLMAEEQGLVNGMVDSRRQEFMLGRYCARMAMASLQLAPMAIPKGPDREPQWPATIVGSISHTGSLAAAAVAAKAEFQSVGLDIESAEILAADLMPMICRIEENPQQDGNKGKLLFSIKEAIYKCIFPLVGQYVDFLEMEVKLHPDGRHYSAIPHSDKCPAVIGEQLEGRYCELQGLILSSAWIR